MELQTFKHADNLHQHTRNQKFKYQKKIIHYDGIISKMTSNYHFLDHKLNLLFNGMMAVGALTEDEANAFRNDL